MDTDEVTTQPYVYDEFIVLRQRAEEPQEPEEPEVPVLEGFAAHDTIPGYQAYYVNGQKYIGWLTLTEDGASKTYYFCPTGTMVTGWQFIDGDWRYFRVGSGTMAFGWQFIDGSWYYLRLITGSRVTGRQYIDDMWYNFASNGKLQGRR